MGLPLFPPGDDPGPSFAALVRRTDPDQAERARLRIGDGAGGAAGASGLIGGSVPVNVRHGTTVTALRFADGVVMAGDRRATEGHAIANRHMDKVYAADAWSAVGIAGAAGPAMEMVRLFQTELEHYEKVSGEPLSMEGKSNKLGQMIKANLPAAFQGLVVVPLYCGWDERRARGRVFRYDVTGGRYEDADYATTGSGGIHARNWIKAFWQADLGRDAAVDLALRALFAAADEDAATGGPDLVRRIYPMVAVISADGYVALADDEIAERSERLYGGREEGSGL